MTVVSCTVEHICNIDLFHRINQVSVAPTNTNTNTKLLLRTHTGLVHYILTGRIARVHVPVLPHGHARVHWVTLCQTDKKNELQLQYTRCDKYRLGAVQHSCMCWGGRTTRELFYHIYHSTLWCLFCWLWVLYKLVLCGKYCYLVSRTVQQDGSCCDGSTFLRCAAIFATVQTSCLLLWQYFYYNN